MRTADVPAAPSGADLPWRERERLGALLQALEPRLLAVARRTVRDPDAARDVLQNAFEKAVRHAAGFRGGARVSTWLHRIVVNESLMWLRAERRRGRRLRPLDEPGRLPIPSGAASPADRLEAARERSRVREALARLRPEERDVLEHCAIEEVSYARYARRAGLAPAAAKSRAFRARRQLQSLLGDTREDGR